MRRCLDRREMTESDGIAGAAAMAGATGCDASAPPPRGDGPGPASASASAAVPPPVARRDEALFVLAGRVAPSDEDDGSESGSESESDGDGAPPRQAEGSPYPLLDPPRRIPDPYGWMRSDDRSSDEARAHLTAENAHTEAATAHLGGLRDVLYREMVGSLRETDHTVPTRGGGYWHYRRTFEGKAYPVHCRAPIAGAEGEGNQASASAPASAYATRVEWDATAPGAEERPVLPGEVRYLDENALAEGRDYLSTGSVAISPSSKLLAYTADFTGDETYGLFVTDLGTGQAVDGLDGGKAGPECDATAVWAADDSALFYVTMDDAHRPYRVYRRRIGAAAAAGDELLFEEPDDLFWVGIGKSADRRYLFVETSSSETSEVHYLDLTDPEAVLRCVARRRRRVLYDVEHREGRWLITTNWSGDREGQGDGAGGANVPSPNMRLMSCRAFPDSEDAWLDARDDLYKVMFDGGPEVALDHVQPFLRHAVAIGREGGIPRAWIIRYGEEECLNDVIGFARLSFPEESYDVGLGPNREYGASGVVLSYDSLVTPLQGLLVDMDDPDGDGGRTVLKAKQVPGYERDLYGCERVVVRSRDGETDIPVSLVYRRDVMDRHLESGEPVPVHLYGYGSYGSTVEDDFDATRLPLLNRGMVYVIAHVRGGGEMGRTWYEEPKGAKFLCKKNTFNDFVDVGRWLVGERGLTSSERLSCEGRSAGGLLIGASINQAPGLFGVAILGVPFVDVVATMTDASIPLTAGEWEEWGNPNEEHFLDYMMSYCPMSNVQQGASYPSMLLTGGLHDPRVQYWEPAKFAATLRHLQDDSSGPVCLKIDMTAGHFSASDRYKYLKELSFDYAFLLDQLGLGSAGLQ